MKNILSVLVVENNPTLASQLVSYLTGLGWDVHFAASGRLALRLIKQRSYDAVLLDTQLPDMTYQDVLSNLETYQGKALPVLTMGGGEALEFVLNDHVVPDPTNFKDVASRCVAMASKEPLAISA